MIYTIIIVTILVIALTAGMYFSSYQDINEKLALKKKYLRSENLLFKSPKIRSRVSYSFGTIACLLLVFIILNDPTVSLPFERITSAEMFNETIDELIMDRNLKEFNYAMKLVTEVNQKIDKDIKVLEDKEMLFFITENRLLSLNKSDIKNNEVSDHINQNLYHYPSDLVNINGLLNYKNMVITYGDYFNDDNVCESIIFIHSKDDLSITNTIYIKGQIQSISIQKDYLYCVTDNRLNKNENYFGKLTGIKFKEEEKYQTNDYKGIYYIPNNNIKYVLGLIKINLKNNKYDMKSLLLSDYFLGVNNSKIYISVNIDLENDNNQNNSYIIQYNFNKMRIEKSNKIEGNIYNEFVFDNSGGFIVTTLSQKDGLNYYKIYKYDADFYLTRIEDIFSEENEILIQDDGFYYLVNKDSKLIRFAEERCLPEISFPIISNELSLDNVNHFNKILHSKIILYKREEESIELRQYDIANDIMEQQIEINTENKDLQKIVFDSYYYGGKIYNFINISVLENDNYTYFIIPYIENQMHLKYQFSFTSSMSIDNISHFYINQYFIVFKGNSILLFSEKSDRLPFEIHIK